MNKYGFKEMILCCIISCCSLAKTSFAAEEPILPPEPPQPPKLSIVDSVTLPCDLEGNPNTKCEVYLVYDTRDDILYFVKRGSRQTESLFANGDIDRSLVISLAFQTIDLVTLFTGQTTAVSNYSAGFKMIDGILKVRITVRFEDDSVKKEQFVTMDLDKYKTP